MARLATFATLALLLAAVSRAQGIPDGSYCPNPALSSLSDMAVLVNSGFLAMVEHASTNPNWWNCGRLMKYTADATGNVTLNEVRGSSDCGSNSRLLVSSMQYDALSQTITSVMTYDSRSAVWNVSLTMANCDAAVSSASPNIGRGKYCGPFGDSIVAFNGAMLWLTSGCAYAGKYRLDNRNQSTTGIAAPYNNAAATWCPNGAVTDGYWPSASYTNYFPDTNELAVVYRHPFPATSVLSMATCATPHDVMLPINTSLCVTSPNDANHDGTSFTRTGDTTFTLILPNYSGGTCAMTGTIAIRGSSLGLVFITTSCAAEQLTYAKLYPDNKIMFIDNSNAYFWATPCPQTVVPNGVYCGGWNALLLIANTTLQLWTDSYTSNGVPSMTSRLPPPTRMFFAGEFVPQADNSTIIRTSTMYKDTYISNIVSMNIVNQTVYVVVQRTSGDYGTQGYAFQTGFCARSGVMANNANANVSWVVPPAPGVPASWLPDITTCASVSGATLTLQSTMGSFTWVWNNSWVPSGLCGFVGYASQRMGQVSYRILFQSCNQSASSPFLSGSNTILRNVVFNNLSLSYVLSNTTANASVTTAECPMAPPNAGSQSRATARATVHKRCRSVV
jgi:hypothetical protein